MTEAPDRALIARVLSGEQRAFGVLVDRYQDQMLAYVRYMGFDHAAACDVVQDAFVRAFRHLERCGDPDRFEGWLFKIVSNLGRSAATRQARRPTEPLDAQGSLVTESPGPDERLDKELARERVRRALDEIPHDQREALVLMYLEGHSVAEIEELTGASKSAVKMRLKRGREALKQELKDVFSGVEAL